MRIPVIQILLMLQWHITEKCDFRCRFCYIPHSRKNLGRDFPKDVAFEVIDDFSKLTREIGVIGRVTFTGGNPLLHKDFFEIAKYTREKGLTFNILGNPTASEDELKELKKLGIFSYQISIDGFKRTHEYFRGKGRFDQAVNFLELEGKIGIQRAVASTVSKKNYKEIPDLIKFLYRSKLVEIYDFSRMVPIGEASSLNRYCLNTEEFKSLLYNVFLTYMKLAEEGIVSFMSAKEPLWALLYRDLGILSPEVFHLKKIRCGCSIGMIGIVMDTNGDVYPCRRVPIVVGNVFKKPLSQIFLFSKGINKLRKPENHPCYGCEIFWICRGCLAISFSLSKRFVIDPNCWRKKSEVNSFR